MQTNGIPNQALSDVEDNDELSDIPDFRSTEGSSAPSPFSDVISKISASLSPVEDIANKVSLALADDTSRISTLPPPTSDDIANKASVGIARL